MFTDLERLGADLSRLFPELKLALFKSLPSTNALLKQVKNQPTLCYTQSQTAGYGQQNRQWFVSNQDLTFSLLLPVRVGLSDLTGLSPLIALTVIEKLRDCLDVQAYFKWPNDMVLEVDGELAKLGGILLEVKKYDAEQVWLIIGIGLNDQEAFIPRCASRKIPSLNKTGCGFANFSQQRLAHFFSALVADLMALCSCYSRVSFEKHLLTLKKRDYFSVGQKVFVYDTASVQQGWYQGLSGAGELLVRINDELHKYHSGSVSIRPFNEL